ncbi:hypothetical protein H5T88_03425 [bacterium]|nr:hypothetical protein [bacterium]
MSTDKLLLSLLLAGGTICGVILFSLFAHREKRELDSVLKLCREKLEAVEAMLNQM